MNNSFLTQQLDLGTKIASQRKALGVRAQSAARSAGISRVTLHRIEKGETSVSLGAYLQVCHALGLHLGILAADEGQPTNQLTPEGTRIRIGDYSQLTALAWQLDVNTLITDEQARGIYERNKRFLDMQQIDSHERALMQRLIAEKGMENLLV
ncbi:helix-turn-helix domain-containing protein [Polynucleobacter sp. 78F-HAINBA]|uniref:helix-turn-helix domain-containing protein n=1 Tax=Polynucleobacter sp. 78F-HAINBA TaxID=2689099 RepID=UPI001C0CC277|nr:helix-turn-helix domain-containing protein [Polynucleobacter sp. 78F-HAINBA]MBU3590642.1 helix-turn-helix domain-containing protein [Polynucleobacter sp. 78F-HAINBA]